MIKSSEADSEVKETDIIFDCPHCGKSLAIDYRGAGLTIKCSDCGSDVQVPIPDGMEIEDIDSPVEDQELRIIHLRRSLLNAQDRVTELENTVEDLMERRDQLERDRSERVLKIGEVCEKTGVIEAALKSLSDAVADLSSLCREKDG